MSALNLARPIEREGQGWAAVVGEWSGLVYPRHYNPPRCPCSSCRTDGGVGVLCPCLGPLQWAGWHSPGGAQGHQRPPVLQSRRTLGVGSGKGGLGVWESGLVDVGGRAAGVDEVTRGTTVGLHWDIAFGGRDGYFGRVVVGILGRKERTAGAGPGGMTECLQPGQLGHCHHTPTGTVYRNPPPPISLLSPNLQGKARGYQEFF